MSGHISGLILQIGDPELKVEGFPTIFAFPKGAKDAPIDISNKPRKNAKQMINTISKMFNIASSRPGEDKYRDAVARLKVVLKEKPDLLQFVADELDKYSFHFHPLIKLFHLRVAKEAESKVSGKPKEDL